MFERIVATAVQIGACLGKIEKVALYSGFLMPEVFPAISVSEMGVRMANTVRGLGLTKPAVGYAVERGEQLARKGHNKLLD